MPPARRRHDPVGAADCDYARFFAAGWRRPAAAAGGGRGEGRAGGRKLHLRFLGAACLFYGGPGALHPCRGRRCAALRPFAPAPAPAAAKIGPIESLTALAASFTDALLAPPAPRNPQIRPPVAARVRARERLLPRQRKLLPPRRMRGPEMGCQRWQATAQKRHPTRRTVMATRLRFPARNETAAPRGERPRWAAGSCALPG